MVHGGGRRPSKGPPSTGAMILNPHIHPSVLRRSFYRHLIFTIVLQGTVSPKSVILPYYDKLDLSFACYKPPESSMMTSYSPSEERGLLRMRSHSPKARRCGGLAQSSVSASRNSVLSR
jgi:hypothetical protein